MSHRLGKKLTLVSVYFCIRKFCPSVITTDEDMLLGKPKTQLSMLMKSKQNTRKSRTLYYFDESNRADFTWLYPIILPSIFPTLFALYKEHYVRDDRKISHVISALDCHGDEELSGILEVRSELERWRNEESRSTSDSSSSSDKTRFSDYLQSATKIFSTFRY